MKNYTDKLIESYAASDDLEQIAYDLECKYPRAQIIYRGWQSDLTNFYKNTSLDFPSDDEKTLYKCHAGLFFTPDITYCKCYGDVIKAYILNNAAKIFICDNAEDYYTNELDSKFFSYSDDITEYILKGTLYEKNNVHTLEEILEETEDFIDDEALHLIQYFAWLELKDQYDGICWSDEATSNYTETTYQIWNFKVLTEIKEDNK